MYPSSPPRHHHRASLVAAALFGLPAQPAAAAVLETVESCTSTIRIDGNMVADQSDAKTDGRVSVAAFYGSAATPEVRTAARSALNGELAANVRMDDKNQYSGTNVTETISAATLDLEPLRHPVITDGGSFWRTTTLDFAAYHGHLDLGLVPAARRR